MTVGVVNLQILLNGLFGRPSDNVCAQSWCQPSSPPETKHAADYRAILLQQFQINQTTSHFDQRYLSGNYFETRTLADKHTTDHVHQLTHGSMNEAVQFE